MKIGDIFTKENYTEHAIWCNENNAMVEDLGNGRYQIVAIPEPLPLTREEVSQLRESAYGEIDKLHNQRQRKQVIGTWTEEDETTYLAEVKARSEDIVNRYPYTEGE